MQKSDFEKKNEELEKEVLKKEEERKETQSKLDKLMGGYTQLRSLYEQKATKLKEKLTNRCYEMSKET